MSGKVLAGLELGRFPSAYSLGLPQAGMRWMESSYPDAARGWVGFNVPMSHKITAAADLLLMPSRFEPCGLNQLYAMAYGTVPVAHATGGLRDTVLPFDPWKGAPGRCLPLACMLGGQAACACASEAP